MKKLTQNDFIKKAIQLHGEKYNYDKVNYINANSKVIITCLEHGDFEQLPRHHLSGQRCGKCHGKSLSDVNYFIKKANKIHSDKYDYSKTIYKHNKEKVIIICNKHGEFLQSPVNHLRGYGCFKCADVIRYDNLKRNTLEEFIEKANKIHNNKYDYSKVKYKHSDTKVCIICSKHGIFYQKPRQHLSGCGCPICNSSTGELAVKSILDKHSINYIQEYRIPQIVNKLYYDFYLPNYNVLIEFHGKQHFEYIPHFHRNGEDDFLKQKNRDDIIRYNANQFRFRYLEFNYKQLKKLTTEEFEAFVIALIKRK